MGWKQHAWALAGYGWLVDEDQDIAEVMWPEGSRPILCLPPGLTAEDSDRAFGWALAEVMEQRDGWLALLRFTVAQGAVRAA